MAIGFIGTGAITEAIVTGLYGHGGHDGSTLVSARNRARAERLGERFGEVEVVEENSELVERSETVVLAVLPGDLDAVVAELKFRRSQTVVSLVAETTIERLTALVQPATEIHRAIPMPPIEHGVGPTVLYPSSSAVEGLFERVGTVVIAESESDFDTFTAASSCMAAFFDLVGSIAVWMERQGLPEAQSATYATALFRGLTTVAGRTDAAGLKALSRECQTIGGLNEQVIRGCADADWSDTLLRQLDGIMERLRAPVTSR